MAFVLDPTLHRDAVWALFAVGTVALVLLLFVRAPYGRHGGGPWGARIPARVAWVLMEAPASLVFLGVYLLGDHRAEAGAIALCVLWQAHYVQRAFVFPFLLRARDKTDPVLVPILGASFNLVNAWVNASAISQFHERTAAWLLDPRFVVGTALFVAGYAINRWADAVLRGLRQPGETGYAIPRGGLYRWVSSPNYLGEIIEWIGWAIASWSWAGAAFAFFTVANLLPRALANHEWYREKFSEYPNERRALIPFVL